jgi:hypothetical protein
MSDPRDIFPALPTREPDFFDDFSGNDLREDLWVGHYFPHWSSPERSEARFEMVPGAGIRLLIEEDQLDWLEEDAPLRVSNLQTGVFSGPLGSGVGTHRHREGLTVRTNTPERILWGPTAGRVVKRSAWAPSYPVILMIDLSEIGARSTREDAHPKSADISWVRGWQL